jgi:HAMP domain-containing protein
MPDIVGRLRNLHPHEASALRLEAAAEIERLKSARHADSQRMVRMSDEYELAQNEIERLRTVITRAKDALLDGQSTQRVHDILVDALHD